MQTLKLEGGMVDYCATNNFVGEKNWWLKGLWSTSSTISPWRSFMAARPANRWGLGKSGWVKLSGSSEGVEFDMGTLPLCVFVKLEYTCCVGCIMMYLCTQFWHWRGCIWRLSWWAQHLWWVAGGLLRGHGIFAEKESVKKYDSSLTGKRYFNA